MIVFTLSWPEGTYHQALEHYYEAREWVLREGLCYASKIMGTINHPAHPDCPLGDRFVPEELTGDPKWLTTVSVVCDGEEESRVVEQLKLPPGANLKRDT